MATAAVSRFRRAGMAETAAVAAVVEHREDGVAGY